MALVGSPAFAEGADDWTGSIVLGAEAEFTALNGNQTVWQTVWRGPRRYTPSANQTLFHSGERV